MATKMWIIQVSVVFCRFFSTWFSSIDQHVAQLSWELMRIEPHSLVLSCYINDGQDTLRDPRNRPDPEHPAHSQRPSMERPCSWPSPEINASNLAQRIAWEANAEPQHYRRRLLQVHSVVIVFQPNAEREAPQALPVRPSCTDTGP